MTRKKWTSSDIRFINDRPDWSNKELAEALGTTQQAVNRFKNKQKKLLTK